MPDDEAERVRLVDGSAASDAGGPQSLPALLRLAVRITGCPFAALTLQDGGQERCAASTEWPPGQETQRHLVECAGVAVVIQGAQVGVLRCMDHHARELDEKALLALRDLAVLAGALMEERLAARGREARAVELASIAKNEFLSRMSHEMRTPLNAVIGFTQLLLSRQDTLQAEEVRDYAEHVLRAGEHLLAMTNDVLDLQHVEEGRAELELVDVALDGVVAQVIAQLSAAAHERGVAFDNQVPDGVAVRADERRLRQVLHNIASNAVKYNRPAGVVRWSVETDLEASRVCLSIEDTGSGLKPAQLERLFQPFERLGRETSTIEGTGLGLILARSLTVAMGGTLQVASAAGVGTRVLLALSMAQQTALPFTQPADFVEKEPSAPTDAAPAPPLRMLYVEDNRINAILFEEAIRLRNDVELRVAEDGTEALAHVRDWQPDILVLDAHLPGMDGFELLRVLREEQPQLNHVPAFMCSADAMPDDVQRAAAAGFTGYWSKPINIAKIMSDLDRISAGVSPAERT